MLFGMRGVWSRPRVPGLNIAAGVYGWIEYSCWLPSGPIWRVKVCLLGFTEAFMYSPRLGGNGKIDFSFGGPAKTTPPILWRLGILQPAR